MIADRLDQLASCGVDAECAEALMQVDVSTAGGVVLLVCEGGAVAADEVVRVLAGDGLDTEVRVFAPESGTWLASEMSEVVLPAVLFSGSGGVVHVVILGADRMAPGVSDRMLKLLEEAGHRVFFWLAVESEEGVSTTVRGRVSRSVRVVGARGVAAVEAVSLGEFDLDVARLALEYALGSVPLARRILGSDVLDVAQRCWEFNPFDGLSVAGFDAFFADVCTVVSGRRVVSGVAAWSALDPTGKGTARSYLLRLLSRERLVAAPVTVEELRIAGRQVAVLDEFNRLVGFNVSPVLAMPVLLGE